MKKTFHFKQMIRMFTRNKNTNILSIAGLAIGIAIAMLIGFWGLQEFNFDTYHKNSDRIYRIGREGILNNELVKLGSDFGPVTVVAKERFAEIEDITRIKALYRPIVTINNKNNYEDGFYATDKNIFSFFSFTLEVGDPKTCLDNRDKIVIDRFLANKFFGKENPIGQIIGMYGQKWQVSAVMNDIPLNSHLRPHALILAESINWLGEKTWGNNDDFVGYMRLRPGTNTAMLAKKITAMTYEFMPVYKQMNIKHFLQPLKDIHFSSGYRFDIAITSDRRIIFILLSIAFLILLIACFNFINLYISTSFLRAKSIGVKKISGCSKFSLFVESFYETGFYVLIATLIAISLVTLALPFFNQFTSTQLEIRWTDYRIYLFLGVLLIATIGIAGAFPVYYITRFNPEQIVRNRFKGKGVSLLQKSLVIGQFAASILLICSTGFIKKQLHYIQNKDLGFSKDHIVYIIPHGNLSKDYDRIRQEMMKDPNLLDVTAKNCLPSDWNSGNSVSADNIPGNDHIMEICQIKNNYPDMMHIPIVKGTNPFSATHDNTTECMVNEQAVDVLGLKDPVGKKITISTNGKNYIIAGVMKNALTKSLHLNVEPQVYLNMNEVQDYYAMLIKIGGNTSKAISTIKDFYVKASSDLPFEYHFLDDVYDNLYKSEKNSDKIITLSMIIAIFLSFMALIAIAHYATERRIKEIGVRKVNGARIIEILTMLNRDFIKWIAVAFVIACPIAWYAMHQWLQNFAFKTELSWWMFASAGIVALAVAVLTVSWQSWRAATRNPVESLRYE